MLYPLNPDFRPGYGKALDRYYTAYCKANHSDHPGADPDRAKAYLAIAESLRNNYPTTLELWERAQP